MFLEGPVWHPYPPEACRVTEGELAASAHLEVPPPYRPEPGQPVYEVGAGEHVAMVAEQDLAGPLRELVMAVAAEGWDGG